MGAFPFSSSQSPTSSMFIEINNKMEVSYSRLIPQASKDGCMEMSEALGPDRDFTESNPENGSERKPPRWVRSIT